ncbi:OmpA family protein [Roseomonas sp. GCM10028921]
MQDRHGRALDAESRRGVAAPRALAIIALAALAVTGCAGRQEVPGVRAAASPVTEPAPPVPVPALPLDTAVAELTGVLLAPAAVPGGRVAVAIDPFIDQGTGTETEATRAVVARMAERVRRDLPAIGLLPLTPGTVNEQPLVLLGSLATEAGDAPPPGAFRLRVVLADLRTGRILRAATARVRAGEIDTTLAPFFRDSPGWLPDEAAAAYLRTVNAGAGQFVDPLYRQAILVQALVAEGMVAYEAGRYAEAYENYSRAGQLPGGDQMRVYNGVYLATRALGRPQDAEVAFGRIVEFGLRHGRLSIRFLFPPGSTALLPTIGAGDTNRVWLRQVARQASEKGACLELTGHASPTGSATANERLSLARAEALRARLVAMRPELRDRIRAIGLGARNPLVGTGADNASDVLDRRVEIEPVSCSTFPNGYL